ncbi:MAG TPA: CBS domain-containing protein [Pyrinomonadaceae bacterium]
MARYRNDYDDDDRGFQRRGVRPGGNRPPWSYNDSYNQGWDRERSTQEFERRDLGRGRFGERADYHLNEPRYTDYSRGQGYEDFGRSSYEGRDYQSRPDYRGSRSRARVRDIMTRDLAVATRETTLHEVAAMMRDEDTGVIPVVEYSGNGNGGATTAERRTTQASGYGKLIGLVTDRDIVVRAVADGKECNATRAEEIMSTDLSTARPHDRLVEVIQKMGDKQVRRIPVVNENNRLLGMVSMGDIAVETEADVELADALEDISKETSFWGKVFG